MVVLLSFLVVAGVSAFNLPSQQLRHQSLHQLSVQSKDSVSIGEDTAEAKDQQLLLEAEDLTNEVMRTELENIFTSSEEAAIYMASSPVTPDEGAFIKEEPATSGDGLFWRGVVVLLCALWASNFAVARIAMDQPGVDSSLYAVARFSLAALSLAPGSIDAARKGDITWETAKGAFVCGMWVAFGYVGQLVSLQTTTPSRACVICSLNCIFVAIVAELMRVNSTKERGYTTDFDLRKLIPALIAVTGVAIIELKGAAGDPTIGDLIAFAQPIGFGMGYIQLEELMKKQPSAALPVSAIKLAAVSMAALAYFEASPHAVVDLATNTDAVLEGANQSLLGGFGFTIPDFSPIFASSLAMGAVLYTGLITTSASLYVESVAFQRVPATDASIILTTEPLFAAAVSAFLVGETFGFSDAIGASFIIGACIYAIKMGESQEVCDEVTKECIVEDAT